MTNFVFAVGCGTRLFDGATEFGPIDVGDSLCVNDLFELFALQTKCQIIDSKCILNHFNVDSDTESSGVDGKRNDGCDADGRLFVLLRRNDFY